MTHIPIAIDARPTQYIGVGVAAYASGLVKTIQRATHNFELHFVVETKRPLPADVFGPQAHLIRTTIARSSKHRDLWENTLLPDLLRHRSIQLFHGLDYSIPVVPTSFRKVVTFHDATVFTEHDKRNQLSKTRIKLLMKRVGRVADLVMADSDFSCDQLRRHIPILDGKIRRIWSGVDDAFYGERQTPNERVREVIARSDAGYILYYGGYAPHKRVPLLADAFTIVAQSRAEKLILVGKASDTLHQVIHQAGLANRTIFFGVAEQKELVDLLDHCKLFISMSSVEGFGLPVAEAMARGAPVLCSGGGSLREIGGDAVNYFQPEPKALACAMTELLDLDERRSHLSAKGRDRARRFRWDGIICELIEAYHQVLGVHR